MVYYKVTIKPGNHIYNMWKLPIIRLICTYLAMYKHKNITSKNKFIKNGGLKWKEQFVHY